MVHMADSTSSTASGQPRGEGPTQRSTSEIWARRVLFGLLAAVALVIFFQVLSAYAPRSWSARVGRLVDGQMAIGIAWGLFYGIVFSFLGVLVAAQARRPKVALAFKPVVVLVGALMALPNWLTLWVVLGTTASAHAGERILDVQAPGFRWATLIGVIIGVGSALALELVLYRSRRRKQELSELNTKMKQVTQAQQTENKEDQKDA